MLLVGGVPAGDESTAGDTIEPCQEIRSCWWGPCAPTNATSGGLCARHRRRDPALGRLRYLAFSSVAALASLVVPSFMPFSNSLLAEPRFRAILGSLAPPTSTTIATTTMTTIKSGPKISASIAVSLPCGRRGPALHRLDPSRGHPPAAAPPPPRRHAAHTPPPRGGLRSGSHRGRSWARQEDAHEQGRHRRQRAHRPPRREGRPRAGAAVQQRTRTRCRHQRDLHPQHPLPRRRLVRQRERGHVPDPGPDDDPVGGPAQAGE